MTYITYYETDLQDFVKLSKPKVEEKIVVHPFFEHLQKQMIKDRFKI